MAFLTSDLCYMDTVFLYVYLLYLQVVRFLKQKMKKNAQMKSYILMLMGLKMIYDVGTHDLVF